MAQAWAQARKVQAVGTVKARQAQKEGTVGSGEYRWVKALLPCIMKDWQEFSGLWKSHGIEEVTAACATWQWVHRVEP